jgi:hypothetical protein
VCQLLYLIIFVPYNLFKLFLVHKISTYNYICENGKRKKEKEFQVNRAGGGGISAWSGARGRGQLGPDGPRGAGDGTADAVGVGPRSRERGRLTALNGDRGAGAGRGSVAGEIPWRFSTVGPVLRRGSGGEARAGVGAHGGGVNLTGGGLGWPVHGGWRALEAVKSPARPPGAIGDE